MEFFDPEIGHNPAATSVGAEDLERAAPMTHSLPGPIQIPHPLECARRRPRRQPRWTPSRDRGHRPRPPRTRREAWHSPRLRTSSDAGPMRRNFTYRNLMVTSAAFGIKSGRDQYFEGPHEPAYFRFLETDCDTVDYQFQGARAEWTTSAGETRHYTFDAVVETVAALRFVEIKADWSYFNDPETADTLEAAIKVILELGHEFERIVGTNLMDQVRLRVVKDIFACRLTAFGQRERDIAHNLLDATSGPVPLGLLHERLSTNRHLATAIANAMLVRREIGFPVDRPPHADTPVHRPTPPTVPGGLRAFLRRHSHP